MNKSEENINSDTDGEKEDLNGGEWEFGWKFLRGPILIAAILTIIFYLCIQIFVD